MELTKTKFILEKIQQYNKIVIHGHIRPDGDSYGAQFGLKYIIENTYPNKKVYAVGEEASYLSHIGRRQVVSNLDYVNALVIVVDTGNRERIDNSKYVNGDYIIKIDHHIPVDSYGEFQWEDTNFSSCSEMITALYINHKDVLKINEKAAIALYTGIVTDTNRFEYRGVNSNTLRRAALLLDTGFNVNADVYSKLGLRSVKQVKFEGFIRDELTITENGFAYVKIPITIQDKYEVTKEETAATISNLAKIIGVKVWAIFIEYDELSIRGRIRSKEINIQPIAKMYDGGGHALAIGTKHKTWNNVNKFIEEIDLLCRNN